MKKSMRVIIGALAGAAIAFFFGTEKGRKWRGEAERQVLPHLKDTGGWILDELSSAEETSGATEEALQDKIEAVRRRLQEQQAAGDR